MKQFFLAMHPARTRAMTITFKEIITKNVIKEKVWGWKKHSLLDVAVAACHRPGAENKMLFHVLA